MTTFSSVEIGQCFSYWGMWFVKTSNTCARQAHTAIDMLFSPVDNCQITATVRCATES